MPRITASKIGLALDMHGCPNRCRHCWLGLASNRRLSPDDVRWAAGQFRGYLATADTPIKSLSVLSSFREPDYADDYRHLYELEEELSDGKPERFELLSIWRLARDPEYAPWARSVGPDTCQISFFGMEATNDWFHRRQGAFQDALTATERLLDAGMKPRWQIFLTRKLLPDLDGLLGLVDRLELRERVRDLGGEFQLRMHMPDAEGEGRKIEHLRPTIDDVASLPKEILEPSRKHFGRKTLWQTEGELYRHTLQNRRAPPEAGSVFPAALWFFVTDDWDVFSNVGTLEPWWRLGNLRSESVSTSMRRFEQDEVPGLRVLVHHPPYRLAEEYGDPGGRRIYSSANDLLALYRERHCERAWPEARSLS
jgi:hypothetical protein